MWVLWSETDEYTLKEVIQNQITTKIKLFVNLKEKSALFALETIFQRDVIYKFILSFLNQCTPPRQKSVSFVVQAYFDKKLRKF